MDGIALDIDFIRKCGYKKKKRFAYRVPIGDYNYLQCMNEMELFKNNLSLHMY